jgi:hypothetical protein
VLVLLICSSLAAVVAVLNVVAAVLAVIYK